MEQATGIEPASSAWEAEALPLNHACVYAYIIYQFFYFVNPVLKEILTFFEKYDILTTDIIILG